MPENDDFNGDTQFGAGMFQTTTHEGRRCNASRAFVHSTVDPATGSSPITIIPNCGVQRVLFEGSEGARDLRAVGVEATELTPAGAVKAGTTAPVYARKEVILAAGAMRSPNVLFHSGVGGAEEVEGIEGTVLRHLPGVGRNLQDHADVVIGFRTKHIPNTFGGHWRSSLAMFRGVRDWMAGGERRQQAMTASTICEAGFFHRTAHATNHAGVPDLQGHFVLAPVVDHGRKLVVDSDALSLHVCNLYPQSIGYVRPRKGVGATAEPAITARYYAVEADMDTMEEGYRLVQDIVAGPEFAAFDPRPYQPDRWLHTRDDIRSFLRRHTETVYHPVGTCRIGDEGDGGVVDSRLRVHGVDRLRIADASVMPRIIGGNTNATSIMIGARCGDFIASEGQRDDQNLPAAAGA
eukprot:TRINITY_DN3233_c0_g1_i1.p1 TRINITY_DN3233_c0_g1~~TRINITY_DN3233_c0_g1_i1.p1  ORF type:complete len:478 (+),score=142.48 TRINITY_DN3233_c0_g1_i1:215-1435(+)